MIVFPIGYKDLEDAYTKCENDGYFKNVNIQTWSSVSNYNIKLFQSWWMPEL